MKKLAVLLLLTALLLGMTTAQAAYLQTVLPAAITVVCGPDAAYEPLNIMLMADTPVTIHSRKFNPESGVYWIQVEFDHQGEWYRAYTMAWGLNVSTLADVAEETALSAFTAQQNAQAYTGPGDMYHRWNLTVPAGQTGTLCEVEGGFALIDYVDAAFCQRRVWVRLDALDCRARYTDSDDTYTMDGLYIQGGAITPAPTAVPTARSTATPAPGPVVLGDPRLNKKHAGKQIKITVGGTVREGVGAHTDQIGNCYPGDTFTVLAAEAAENGKVWYMVDFGGRYGWLASGLTDSPASD